MRLSLRRLRSYTAMVLCAGALAACDDDDDPIAPPASPAGVTAAATGETSARVTWTAVQNADAYVVERAAGTGAFSQVATPAGTATQYDDNGLQAGTAYRYRVAARRGSETSAFSNEVTVTLQLAALATPTGVTATALSPSRNQITFTAVTGAAGYTVQRATGTGEFAQIGTTATTTYVDSVGVTAGTAYRYRVQATAPNRTSSAFSTEATVTAPQPTAVALPTVITANRTLSRDTVYQLNGYTKVLNGATLRIQSGTRVLGGAGSATTGGIGGSLFIYRGARLVVEGTAAAPVVFTSSRAAGQRAAGDWGGMVIVGRASTNRTAGTVLTESPGPVVDETNGGGGTQQQYNNGTDDNDSSGDIRYLRIEFAGFAVSQDNELNALSMYAVGRGTRLEYVQALVGLDDHFEWFGGTVDGRYLVSYEAGDDHFDTSEGYRGRNQFLVGLQTFRPEPNANGSAGGAASDPQFFEADGCQGTGCPAGNASTPFSMPVFANFTIVGTGPGVLPTAGGNGLVLRRGTGGTWVNGIVARMQARAITVPDTAAGNRLTADSLSLRNIFLAENVANFDPAGAQFGQASRFASATIDSAAAGTTAASLFTALPAVGTAPTTATLDWTPAAAAPAAIRTGGLATFAAPLTGRMANFFGGTVAGTAYRGAADPAGGAARWWQGWTVYARN